MKKFDLTNILILIDDNLKDADAIPELQELIENFCAQCTTVFIKLEGEPTYQDLDREFDKLVKLNPDAIVAIGGGSLLDLAKGISILFTNNGNGLDFRGMHKVKKAGLPLVVFPSTAGTGTEMTWTASFVDAKTETKLGINGDFLFPTIGVLEPKLLLQAPKAVILSAGLDALVHSIESVTSKMATPFTIALGVSATNRVLDNLAAVINDSNSIEAILQIQIAASEAGLAMLNSSGGPASGISYPLGVHFRVPHGFAGGLLLPEVIKENIKLGYKGYDTFNQRSTGNRSDLSTKLFKLYETTNVPTNFSRWGFVSVEDVEKITNLTMEQRQENLKLNPVNFDKSNVSRVLEKFI